MTVVGLSHPRAITRISDPVHGVIELTIFDRDIVDTPQFQRLHFILQQSVNYVSFPANKNTRFPHSIGTAHLAGRIFASALSNSENNVLREFVRTAGDFLHKLIDHVAPPTHESGGLGRKIKREQPLAGILSAYTSTISGMSRFLHTPLMPEHSASNDPWRVDTTDKIDTSGRLPTSFIIDTYWQALRIYALTHDIGHLPMSHAFENAVDRVSSGIKECSGKKEIGDRFGALVASTRNDFSGMTLTEDNQAFFYLLERMLDIKQKDVENMVKSKPLHEVRGLAILNDLVMRGSNVSQYFDDMNSNDDIKRNYPDKESLDAYARVIHNLALCIVYSLAIVDKNSEIDSVSDKSFLYTIRQLVDGEIDGDRLDYTLRDCKEAGMSFGNFDIESIVRNAMLLKNTTSKENSQRSKLLAIGFGVRAIPGIEQFFEARYQSYRYLVHHRTASRSNIAVENLVEKLFVICALFPESDCADILQRYGYITRSGNELIKVLPVMTDDTERIDDYGFRTLLHEVKNAVRNGKLGKNQPETDEDKVLFGRIRNEISILCDIVLFRDLRHIVTIFKESSMDKVLSERLLISDAEDRNAFTHHLEKNITELFSIFRKSLDQDWPAESPITLMYEHVKSKVFDADDAGKSPFEKRIWIRTPIGELVPLDGGKISVGLSATSRERKADRNIRVYAAGKNLKTDLPSVRRIESLIIAALKRERDGFRSQNVNQVL